MSGYRRRALRVPAGTRNTQPPRRSLCEARLAVTLPGESPRTARRHASVATASALVVAHRVRYRHHEATSPTNRARFIRDNGQTPLSPEFFPRLLLHLLRTGHRTWRSGPVRDRPDAPDRPPGRRAPPAAGVLSSPVLHRALGAQRAAVPRVRRVPGQAALSRGDARAARSNPVECDPAEWAHDGPRPAPDRVRSAEASPAFNLVLARRVGAG